MLALRAPFDLLAWLLEQVAGRESQRAEHLADVAAVRLAGTSAAVALLRNLLLAETAFTAVNARLRGTRRDVDVWEVLAEAARSVPAVEMDRRELVAAAELTRVDDSHPATSDRLAVVRSLADVPPAFELSPDRSRNIDGELEEARETLGRRIRDDLLE